MQAQHDAPLASPGHVGGLDGIRFVCASWVVFGHFGFAPFTQGIDRSHPLGLAVSVLFNNLFSGPAAVIVFFVISGFCIHYPFRDGHPIPLRAYYTRRYLRVLIPMAAAILLAAPLRIDLMHSVLWSLICEEIYYLLYPLVLVPLRRRMRWWPIIAVSYVLAFAVVLSNPRLGNYGEHGPALNWILGLPCWLLGCQLAESLPFRTPSRLGIWTWRAGILGLATVCSVLRFHSPLTYPWTLNWFALAAFFWLGRETAYFAAHGGSAWLEKNGKWSYSLYLTHYQARVFYGLVGLPFLGHLLDWILRTGFIYGCSYAFYRLVEKPSHEFARTIGRRLLERRELAMRPAE
jgi:peptidoglycan/LPS O-acetylase OafA/YrhL